MTNFHQAQVVADIYRSKIIPARFPLFPHVLHNHVLSSQLSET